MSASRKFDLSSDSPDRPLYGSGHHGSYSAASLDRPGSFRENMETPLLSSLPNMTRSCSAVTQGDVHSFFQCVRFDPKSMVAEHKLNRPPEFKRLASAAVNIPPPDSLHVSSKSKHLPSSSAEDLRRLKSGVRESGTKARERVKILNDCLSVINKFFPAIPSRKRSSSILQTERTTSGMGLSKMATQNHVNSSGVEPDRCEERTNNPIPNKRPRTSILDSKIDSRVRSPGRPSGTLIRRAVGRLPNTGVVQGEDHTLSIGVNGWDKSKMKKRRTGTKPDIPASSMATKPTDGYRESKESMQPRVPIDSRSRLPDSHFSRSVIVNGSVSAAKTEVSAQATSGMHSAICSTDSENSSPLYDKRDHQGGKEKGRAKIPNKDNSREGFSSGSPTSAKLSANVRAPRSGSSGVSKLSQVVPRSPSSNNWELNNCTSKSPGALAATNRRRTPVGSPSPPVTNWVQKPQKISRTPRRNNLSPIIPGFDENPVLATTSKLMVTPPDSPQLFKLKSDYLSPGALSESEELHDAEVMFREKSIMCDDVDVKRGNVQKLSALMIPPKNNKAVSRATHGDGVKRQGRTGRGFSSSRSISPLTAQKHGVLGTPKQIRSARPGLEKSERVGRPPTRKLSDRKPYARQKQTATTVTADLSVGSNDGHEELLAAARAVTNTAQALSSPLWKDVEPVFRFISDKDISYLKHQINPDSPLDTHGPTHPDTDSSSLVPHGRKMNDYGREESETLSVELSPEDIPPSAKTDLEISLCQRLMAALIPEDRNLELLSPGKEDNYDMYDSGFKVEKDMEADTFCFEVSQICGMSGYPSSNGYSVNSNGKSGYELGRPKQDTNVVSILDTAVTLHYESLENGTLEDQVNPVTASSDYQYGNMSLNERLLVELKSIGICPDLESADDELNGIISGFEEKLQEKVSMKKIFLGKLLSPSDEAKKFQEREFEGRALDKLCGMANEKYMSSWGSYAQGMKSSTGKMAKQAALSLVKRTVHRCREFEVAGKSCFGEPMYKDLFLSEVLRLGDAQSLNSNSNNEFGKLHRTTSRCSTEIRTPDNQQSPSNNHKEDSWSDRVKKRELLLDDIGGMMNGSISSNAKGKRSERDREIKEFSSTKIKGERKYKTKPKKTSLLSTTISVPVGKMLEQPKVTISPKFKSHDNNEEILEDPIDLSGLQLPGMEDFGGPDDLGGQGGDIDSWLNIEDDELYDHDFMGGLGIPMDDLSGLDMLV